MTLTMIAFNMPSAQIRKRVNTSSNYNQNSVNDDCELFRECSFIRILRDFIFKFKFVSKGFS